MAGIQAGKLRFGSVPLAVVYHFEFKKWKPYVGAGIHYTMIFKVEEQDITDVRIDPKIGTMLRGGFDYMITDRFGLGTSVQKFYTKATLSAQVKTSSKKLQTISSGNNLF